MEPAQLIKAPSFETAGDWVFDQMGGPSSIAGRYNDPANARTGSWFAYLTAYRLYVGGPQYRTAMLVSLHTSTGRVEKPHVLNFWTRHAGAGAGPLVVQITDPTLRTLRTIDPAHHDWTNYNGFSIVFQPRQQDFTLRWLADTPAPSTWYIDDAECYDDLELVTPGLFPGAERSAIMPISSVQICNMAIAAIGVGSTIASMDEDSELARICRIYFEHVRDSCLEDVDWRFASRRKTLVKVDDSDEVTEWAYRYQYPNDCLVVREIVSGKRALRADQKIPFAVESDATHGRVILTDQADAIARYTAKIEDPSWWPKSFVDYLTYSMAVRLAQAKRVDPSILAQVVQLQAAAYGKACSVNGRERQEDPLPDARYIAERNA